MHWGETTGEQVDVPCSIPAYLPATGLTLRTEADASEADLAALRELVRQCSRAIKDDAERTALTFEIHETRLAMKLADERGLKERGQALLKRREDVRNKLGLLKQIGRSTDSPFDAESVLASSAFAILSREGFI